MRKAVVVAAALAVMVFAVVGVRALRRRPLSGPLEGRPAATSTSQKDRGETQRSPIVGVTRRRLAARHAAASTAPASRAGALPHDLDEVPRSAILDKALADITRAWDGSPQAVANLNYRLELLSNIADCLGGRVHHSGFVDVVIRLSGAEEGKEAIAQGIELKRIQVVEDERDLAVNCIDKSLVGSRNVVADARFAGNARFAPMRIRLPIEDSAIYSFLETGDMKYYGNDYDGRP